MTAVRKFRGWGRRGRSVVTICLLLAATGLIFAATSSQAAGACPIPGNFEIDGDMTHATCTPPADDWDNASGVQSTNQGGTYSTSNKDDSDPSGWTSSGSTPDKTNFEQAYATSRVVGGHFYVFVAWERTDTSGTQGYAIEIDNSGANVATDGTPQPDRGSGGTVFYISSQGSSAPQFASACSFSSQSTYGTTCTNVNASVTSAINTAPITDPFRNTTQAAGSFFEAALDVTGLTGIVPSCPGAAAASVYLRSITGQTTNGNLKGYMAPLSVAPDSTCVPPVIDTTATPGGSLNPPGATQQDMVSVGNPPTTPAGIGTAKFFLCSPSEVTANGGDCSANGTQVGGVKTLDVNGQATSDNVTGLTAPNDLATGKYCWRAEFTPGANDHNYLAGSHTNSAGECFTIVHGTPKISTQIAVTGANAPGLGFTTLGDGATVTNFVGSVAGETVTFKLYGPYANGVTPTCTGPPAFTTTGTLNAGGNATTAGTYQPTAAGKYVWIASYPGDLLNDPVSGQCTDANESATIVPSEIDVTKSANPVGPVSAGDSIGFDITVTNPGSVPATNAHVTDSLPSGADGVVGGDLDWSLDPAYTGCTITGAVGSQVLDCNLGRVNGPGSLPVIHISSQTSTADCGVVKNKATASTTNGAGGDSNLATVTVQCPGLSLSKTADAASVNAGSQIGFTVTASNSGAAGTGTAHGVVIDDPLPAGSGVDWSLASGPPNCSVTGAVGAQTLHCTAVDLAPGASEVVHVVSGTAFASCATYPNTASLTATNNPPLTASASTTVQCANLTLTKTADNATVSAGDQIGFTITAGNSGTGTATGAVISDPLPGGSGVDWSIASATGPETCGITGTAPNQTLTCAGDLAPGASEVVHVVSGTAFASCKAYPNTASLTATNNPPLTASASTTVQCPDLTLTKTADDAIVNAGDQIGFTITASNSPAGGTGTARNVVIDDPLPAGSGVDWSIASGPPNCSITGAVGSQTLHCTAVDLPADNSESVHVISGTTATSCATYPNEASLTATNNPPLTADASTTVLCPLIHIAKKADAAKVNVGSPIGFTLTVWNDGSGAARGVRLSDTLPTNPGLSWSIASQGTGWGGSCAIAAGVLTCGPVTVPAGTTQAASTFTVHITSPTTAATGGDCPGSGTVDNTGTVTTANGGSDQSSASTCVQALVDLSITKTGAPNPLTLGTGNITWTIVVTNNGPDPDTGVKITDPLPAGNTFVSVSTTKGTCTGGAIISCDIGNMAVGEKATITLVTTPSTTGNQTNTVTVVGARPETNTANNTATATVLVVGVVTPPVYCVAVSKVTPKQLFVGRKTTLTIHVTQHGKAKAGVRVLIKGPKFLTRTKPSNSKGAIKQKVKMTKAGVMIFTPIASKRCNTKRIGITGVFTPPVTG
jgi:uncharacterized repeat protein (TIGR01451 family)